jgi:glycolate oxidase FAD binding subunit
MIRPASEEDLAGVVAGAKGSLSIQGGGTRGFADNAEGERLTTSGITGITLYEPGALTLVARAGTPVEEIRERLARDNQRLPFEPMDHRALLGTTGEPTIGGVVAANISGPRRVMVGAARDYALGLRFVDGRGTVIRNGGRVMKNVTGYDLVKLLSGSYGTLGILTEVSLKVLPKVAASATIVLGGLSDDRAVAAMAAALGSPFEVSGAAHDPGTGETLLRLEGFDESVRYRSERLAELLKPFAPSRMESDADVVAKLWAAIRDVTAFAGKEGDVWRLSVKPSDAPDLVGRSGAKQSLYDWGGGLVWLRCDDGTDLRARLAAFAGHATLIRANAQTRRGLGIFQPEPAPLARISAGLRAQFDPRGILNPGMMG